MKISKSKGIIRDDTGTTDFECKKCCHLIECVGRVEDYKFCYHCSAKIVWVE